MTPEQIQEIINNIRTDMDAIVDKMLNDRIKILELLPPEDRVKYLIAQSETSVQMAIEITDIICCTATEIVHTLKDKV